MKRNFHRHVLSAHSAYGTAKFSARREMTRRLAVEKGCNTRKRRLVSLILERRRATDILRSNTDVRCGYVDGRQLDSDAARAKYRLFPATHASDSVQFTRPHLQILLILMPVSRAIRKEAGPISRRADETLLVPGLSHR